MAIIVNLDVMLAKRKMQLKELSEEVGITQSNLSNLKTGKARAIRFTTLEAICKALDCQPGDILEYRPDFHYPDDPDYASSISDSNVASDSDSLLDTKDTGSTPSKKNKHLKHPNN